MRNNYKYILAVPLLLILLTGAATSDLNAQTAQQAETWQNPVFDTDFPDPTAIRAGDGYFYAYATQAVVGVKMNNIQLARSSDLVI